MMDRRDFLRSVGVIGTASLLGPELILASSRQTSLRYFNLHPFIAAHPEAVFIKRTHVAVKTDSAAKKQEGTALVREIFVPQDVPGIPLSQKIAIKPNLTNGGNRTDNLMGIDTDVDFVEGVIEGMKELGLRGEQFYMREGNHLGDAYDPNPGVVMGYRPMAKRMGAHLTDLDSGRDMANVRFADLREGSEVTWVEVPDGVIFRRIGYVSPINQADSWLLNIAKFKAHGMGLTLCSKNQQGMCVHPYIHYCESLSDLVKNKPAAYVKDIQPDFLERVQQLHKQHLEAGVPRWDRPGKDWNSGYGMEGWSQKTLDNLSVTDTGLALIEGIYGRNGNGFANGPGPGNTAQDFMTNVLIFGKNPIKVDIIGHWLGGHEPGAFGLFHAARDRGLTNVINPMEIPVYAWEGGVPVRTPLTDFERSPLVTYYLRRDYAGQNEPLYHVVNDLYDYGPPTLVSSEAEARPQSYVLGQNFPNPFNASTLIEYRLPREGHVRLEVYDVRGQVVDLLVDGRRAGRAHVVAWDAGRMASGTYFYRFRVDGFQETRKMLLVR
jgi:hypothetical protein